MAPPWDTRLGTYPAEIDDHQAVVVVDLGAVEAAPVGSHPVRILVELTIADPNHIGMPRPQEARVLAEVEARLTQALAAAADAWFVGRLTGNGTILLAYYGLAQARGPVDFTSGWGDYRPEPHVEPDPDWEFVHEVLAPDAWQRSLISSFAAIEALRANGDEGRTPRPIDHRAAFNRPEDASAASLELAAAGFTVHPPQAGDAGATLLTFEQPGAPADLLAFLAPAHEITVRNHGRYDGWGSPIAS